VQLDHVTVPVEGLDHMLALAVEDEERELISEPLYHFINLGHLVMFCDQVRILHVSGNGMHIAQVITDLLGIFCRCIYHIYHLES